MFPTVSGDHLYPFTVQMFTLSTMMDVEREWNSTPINEYANRCNFDGRYVKTFRSVYISVKTTGMRGWSTKRVRYDNIENSIFIISIY